MFNWLKKRREEKLENSRGFAEKKNAIAKTTEIANEVIRKMESLKHNRRTQNLPFQGQNRRFGTA